MAQLIVNLGIIIEVISLLFENKVIRNIILIVGLITAFTGIGMMIQLEILGG